LNGGDTYEIIAGKYANLTTTPWLQKVNSYNENSIPEGSTVNVSINCSCRNAEINKYYGLFLTYPLMNATTDSLSILSQTNNVPSS
jgi:chitin elicitor receptor kinase 1